MEENGCFKGSYITVKLIQAWVMNYQTECLERLTQLADNWANKGSPPPSNFLQFYVTVGKVLYESWKFQEIRSLASVIYFLGFMSPPLLDGQAQDKDNIYRNVFSVTQKGCLYQNLERLLRRLNTRVAFSRIRRYFPRLWN